MKREKLRSILDDCCNDISFVYNGKNAGVTSEVHDYKKIYHAWYGERVLDYHSLDELLEDKIFDGNTLLEIAENVDMEVA